MSASSEPTLSEALTEIIRLRAQATRFHAKLADREGLARVIAEADFFTDGTNKTRCRNIAKAVKAWVMEGRDE